MQTPKDQRSAYIAWIVAGLSFVTAIGVVVAFVIYQKIDRPKIVEEAALACVDAAPPSCPVRLDCSRYIEAMEEWIKTYEGMEDQWLDCTRDLVRCQNESNAETLCTEPYCE